MNMLYGITAVALENWSQTHEENVTHALHWLREKQLFTMTDKVVIVTDLERFDREIPVMEIATLSDMLE